MTAKKHADDIEMVPEEATGPLRPDEDGAIGAEAASKVKKLRDELKHSEAERKEYLDGWQRTKADLINYKKDEAKRFDQFSKFAAEGVISDVVHVLDNFDLALRHSMPKDVEKGIILIRSQLEDALRRWGLEPIHALGQMFDPASHESVGEEASDKPEGTVVEELQRGYRLNGKVLRPARVKVSKSKT